MTRVYLKGFIPFVLVLAISTFNLRAGQFEFKLSWWLVYLILSYLIIFPWTYRRLSHNFKQTPDFANRLTRSQEDSEQKALRMGSNYANTGQMGVGRIGDASGHESWLTRWGTDVVLRLFLILAGVFPAVYWWVKDRQTK
ncbi:hypothetical protein [Levilactobacillus huananensis]|uniref:hypothetical protein n=1 Tax=Levilactobacillus huananensis TaxID=2486019 RepID=UPI001CDC675C|nr:hypothetical protein [Levilactobacillus huananensis]